ncbi:LADA_0H05402g1_1 [Lachancea dasiensis]|uniref:LADA_0H05402g1_1 n=1 Tax=Lachancea dasiensis TaxID=1072105 RepID=A0A1G4K150_9SACH|nr:LADA_0H05402g1_1 [Lachancea dasiensis]
MRNERHLKPEIRKRESEANRARSPSPSLFFKSSPSSNLLKLRKAHSSFGDSRASTGNELDSTIQTSKTGDPAASLSTEQSVNRPPNDMMVEVLPSFELYNTLHRHIPQGNVDPDRIDFPPTYQEVQARSPLLSSETDSQLPESSEASVQSFDHLAPSPSGGVRDEMHNLEALGTVQEPIQDDVDETDSIYIDKIYSLPKSTKPIEIDIHVTKEPAAVDKKAEDESLLREYTSGDILHGYVIIANKSSVPIKFEMFYVTLEGHATVVDRECGKRTVKRFLRMVDLSASWSYSDIDVANGVNYLPGAKDFENCTIGLLNSRTLQPNTRYKKYFMFKFPSHLLDVSCKHQQFSHCLVPPTLGIDPVKGSGKYSGIKINPLLGYGHTGTRGSPILTDDLSGKETSISYIIDTKVVGKDARTRKLNILKEREYNLRFVPFGFCRPFSGERSPLNQLQDITRLVQERLGALKNVMQRLEANEQITNQDLHNTDVSGCVSDPTEIDSEEILRRKLNQVYISNRIDPISSSFPLRASKVGKVKTKMIETEFKYSVKGRQKTSNKLKKGLFGSLAGSPASSTGSANASSNKSGIIVLTSEVPKAGLSYMKPSLLRKTNKFEKKGAQNKENWKNLTTSLPEKDKEILDQVIINMRCIQANNGESHEPPQIHSVTTELVSMSVSSTNSIPIKLDADLILRKGRLEQVKNVFQGFKSEADELRVNFEKNRENLNKLFNKSARPGVHEELRFSNFLSDQILCDIESIATLRSGIQTLPHIFKRQIHTLVDEDDSLECSPSKSPSATSLLSATFSGSSIGSHEGSVTERLRKQLFREWVRTSDHEYDRVITVNLQFGDDIRETLIPTFESCLVSRLYCIRINVKFEGQLGIASIDVPAQVRLLEA